MPLVPLQLPPGVYRNGTDMQAAGRWRDASLVRWADGTMRPVAGWEARFDLNDAVPRGRPTAKPCAMFRSKQVFLVVSFGRRSRRNMRHIDEIIVHCTATQIRLTTVGGTLVFNAGNLSIRCYY